MIAGYPNMPIDYDRLTEYLRACEAHGVTYGFGSKCPEAHIGKLPIVYGEIDCSGFFRTAICYATNEELTPPDGSYTQGDWLSAKGYKATKPEYCGLQDGHVRVCVHHPDDLDGTGHIWIVRNGVTTESYGGHGPGSRAWNVRLSSGHTLDQLATLCFAVV